MRGWRRRYVLVMDALWLVIVLVVLTQLTIPFEADWGAALGRVGRANGLPALCHQAGAPLARPAL